MDVRTAPCDAQQDCTAPALESLDSGLSPTASASAINKIASSRKVGGGEGVPPCRERAKGAAQHADDRCRVLLDTVKTLLLRQVGSRGVTEAPRAADAYVDARTKYA